MEKAISAKFNSYPLVVKTELLAIRSLIFDIATRENLGSVTESLKWGQLSFSTRKGSPIRIDWSEDVPESLSVFFHCQTKLIATFREVYSEGIEFAGNREMRVPLLAAAQRQDLAQCFAIALCYHKVKEQPLLGL